MFLVHRSFTTRHMRSSLFSLALIAALLSGAIVSAQVAIAPYTWTGSPASATGPSLFTTLPASTTPGTATVNVSQWDRDGVAYNAAGSSYNSKSWEVGGSLSSAITNGKDIFFTITNAASTELHVTRLFIRSQVSATGPQNVQVQYTLGSTTSNFGSTISTAHTASAEDWDISGDVCIGPGQTITFRLYGWGGSSSAGTLRINDGTMVVGDFATGVSATATNTSPVCTGELLSFTGAATGGIPGYSYSWAGPAGFSSTEQNPSISSPTTASAGVYTLTVSDTLNCTTDGIPATTTVTVNASPAPITGTTTVCPLLTTTLSCLTTGGTWSSSNTGIATVSAGTGVVTGIAPGTATITYQVGASCYSTTTVTVNTPPDPIGGASSVCLGFTTTLNSLPAGGVWTSSAPAVGTIGTATGVLGGVATGTSIITYTYSGCIATSTITVYPFPSAITGTTQVCEGLTTTLSSTSGGGTWSSSDVAVAGVDPASGVVSGVAAGTAGITYMLGGGCAVNTVVTVNPVPGPIGGTPVVCVNASTGFSNPSSGGTWSSGDISIVAIGSLSGVATGVAPGTANITYTLPTGCIATRTITVNAIPATITGASGVCLGSTVTLSDTSPGGTWSSSSPATAAIGASTGIVSGNTVGTATISYTFTATGCFITRTQTVHSLPTAITGPSFVCPGLNITLVSTPTGGIWTSASVTTATVSAGTGVVAGVAAGAVNITYTLPTGCFTSRSITVNPAPPAIVTPLGDTTFCPGDFVVLTANTGVGLTYQWLSGITPISGATAATFTTSSTGNYRVRITNSLGCPTVSTPMAVLVNTIVATVTVPGGVTSDCSASPIILNGNPASPTYAYQWLLNGTAIAGATASSHTAALSGEYSVLITNATGCTDLSDTVVITVIPSPSPLVTLSGPLSFCIGGSVTMTAESGSGYTYQWNDATGPIAGATTASYTSGTTNDYYVTVTNTFGCTVNSAINNVVATSLPDVTIDPSGPTTFCTGGAVTLNTLTGPGYSFQWYRGGAAIPGATSGAYIATTSGGYRVRITNIAVGCTDMTAADTMVVVINSPEVVALTPARFCWGGSSHLSTTVSALGGTVMYQWLLNGITIPGATNSTYTATTPGDYSCTITVPSSCVSTTSEVAVTEVPLPDPVITQSGPILSTQLYFTSYQWYKDLLTVPGATTASMLHTGVGSYKVQVTDTNGCQAVSHTYNVTGNPPTTAVSGAESQVIRIYPNPVTAQLHIDAAIPVRVSLTGIDGRILHSQAATRHVDMSILPEGIYMLRVFDSEGNLLVTEKVTKQSR